MELGVRPVGRAGPRLGWFTHLSGSLMKGSLISFPIDATLSRSRPLVVVAAGRIHCGKRKLRRFGSDAFWLGDGIHTPRRGHDF